MLELNRFKVLTFDCYGTLIDWESGILGALEPLRSVSGSGMTDDDVLERYALVESAAQTGEYRRYRDVLGTVTREMANVFDIPIGEIDEGILAASIERWTPFPDTVEALKRLKTYYKLAIISNIDDDLFEYSARHLEVPFDYIITAQQAKSYKPSHNNFRYAMDRMGIRQNEILHVAQSLYHDIVPAKKIGLANVWVNRRMGSEGFGATRRAEATPTLEVPDLETLAGMAETAHADN